MESDSEETDDREEESNLQPEQPIQSTTMLNFFKRVKPATTTQTTTFMTTSTKDKKRKMESKVVTNGVDEQGHKSQSPPAKKRIAKAPTTVTTPIKAEKAVEAASVPSAENTTTEENSAKENDDDDDESHKNGVRISNFFRPISKKDFIKETREKNLKNTKEYCTMTVKAIVHSPSNGTTEAADGETASVKNVGAAGDTPRGVIKSSGKRKKKCDGNDSFLALKIKNYKYLDFSFQFFDTIS